MTTTHEFVAQWHETLSLSLRRIVDDALTHNSHVPPQQGVRGRLVDDTVAALFARILGCESSQLEERNASTLCATDAPFERYLHGLATGVWFEDRSFGRRGVDDWLTALRHDPWRAGNLVSGDLSFTSAVDDLEAKGMFLQLLPRLKTLLSDGSEATFLTRLKWSPLSMLGIWSHLIPFSIRWDAHLVGPSQATLKWVLRQQHSDGYFYPIDGGGACPDMNAVNILVALRFLRPSHDCEQISAALSAFAKRLIGDVAGLVFVPENFRSGPRRLGLLKSAMLGAYAGQVEHWLALSHIDDVHLYSADLWSTMIRYLAIAKSVSVSDTSAGAYVSDHFRFGVDQRYCASLPQPQVLKSST